MSDTQTDDAVDVDSIREAHGELIGAVELFLLYWLASPLVLPVMLYAYPDETADLRTVVFTGVLAFSWVLLFIWGWPL